MSKLQSFMLSLFFISSVSFADNVLWQQGQSFVSLTPSVQSNNHPVNISAEKLAKLLSTLHYKAQSDGRQKQLFDNPKKLQLLSRNLSTALATATSRQDVRFLLLAKPKEGGFFARLLANGGRIFYQDNRLNIVFSELLVAFEPKNIYGQVQASRPWRDASTQVAYTPKHTLLSGNGIEKKRSDWLLIDPNITTAAPQVEAVQNNAGNTGATQPKMSLKQLLKQLKNLHQEGLISDSQYQNKVNQILEAL